MTNEHVALMVKDYALSEQLIIKKNNAVVLISEKYLKRSSYSPSYYGQLLENAEKARSKNCLYVEWNGFLLEIPHGFL
jgi:hypothetical protein